MFFIKKKNSIRAINSNITGVQRAVNNPLIQVILEFSFKAKSMASWEGELSLPPDYASNYVFITAYLWKINDERGTLNRFAHNTSNNKLHVIFLTVGNWADSTQTTYTGTIAAIFYKRNYPNA